MDQKPTAGPILIAASANKEDDVSFVQERTPCAG
jgi:hypothetical protein